MAQSLEHTVTSYETQDEVLNQKTEEILEVLFQLGLKFHGDRAELEDRIKDIIREEMEATREEEVMDDLAASAEDR